MRTFASGDVLPDLSLPNGAIQAEPIEGSFNVGVDSKFSVNGLSAELQNSTNKLWLHPPVFDELGLANQAIEGATFTEVPEWREGRKASGHQVFFGNLDLHISGQEEPVRLPVACKPYINRQADAVHEYVAFEYVNDRGFIEPLHPVGFWVDNDGDTLLLTHFEEKVVSLDNEQWERTAEEPLRDHINIVAALEKTGYILGRYHGDGLISRDALARNMAADDRGVRAVDLTSMRLMQTPEVPNRVQMREAMLTDMVSFLGSINALGFLADLDGTERRQIIRSTLIAPYKNMLLHPSVTGRATYAAGTAQMVLGLCDQLDSLSADPRLGVTDIYR